jgi:hypothetical protein
MWSFILCMLNNVLMIAHILYTLDSYQKLICLYTVFIIITFPFSSIQVSIYFICLCEFTLKVELGRVFYSKKLLCMKIKYANKRIL